MLKAFQDGKDGTQRSATAVYFRLLFYVKPFLGWFIISFFGYMLFALAQPLFAKVIGCFVEVLQNGNKVVLNLLLVPFVIEGKESISWILTLMLLVAMMSGIGFFLGSFYLSKVSLHVIKILREDQFNHLLTLPCSYFDERNSGYVLSKITYNVSQIALAATEAIRSILREGLTLICLLIFLLYTQWRLTLVFLVIAPVLLLLANMVGKHFRKLSHYIQDAMGEVTHIVSEHITNYRVVRGFGGESYAKKHFKKACKRNLECSIKMEKLASVSTPVLRFVVVFALSIMMSIAAYMKSNQIIYISTADLVAFLLAAAMIPKPVRQLCQAYVEIQKGVAAAESIFELLDEPSELETGTRVVKRVQGYIEVKNLHFSYHRAKNYVLKGINFTVNPGETVALVGRSGSGKTTLMHLIMRYYLCTKGQILLDHYDIRSYALSNFRQQIAEVAQHVDLFSDTVKNNITYGVAHNMIDEERLLRVSDMAYVTNFC